MKKAKRSAKVVKTGVVNAAVPVRKPLASFPPNVPASPIVPLRKKRKPMLGKGTPLKPLSPVVDVDIIILDAQGRRISQERRVSRPDVQVNPTPSKLRKNGKRENVLGAKRNTTVLSDSEDEFLVPRRARQPINRAQPIVILSDDSENEEPNKKIILPALQLSPETPSTSILPLRSRLRIARKRPNIILSPTPTPSPSPSPSPPVLHAPVKRSSRQHSTAHSTAPIPPAFISRIQQSVESHLPRSSFEDSTNKRSKPRQLTPIRSRPGRTIFPAPPSPPSPTTPTDFDLSLDLSNLALSPSALAEVEALHVDEPLPPAYLQPLLTESVQKQSQIEADVVLKVIPLRDEECGVVDVDVDAPAPSDAKDVLKEIIVTRALGDMCAGFVTLLRTYIVRGKYPSLLLDLWDEYNEKKGSEAVRPDCFTVSQVFAIIVLPNGGADLEAYAFDTGSKNSWRQACSLFWQVARALSEAEDLVRFEHRDLHWGQILVKDVPVSKPHNATGKRIPMDHTAHGVSATIIDLGLARMDAEDGDGTSSYWTPFEEEIFEGEGDYQFDVYRMMKVHNGGLWEDYRPLTNVMWLHYLSLKLLRSKCLRAPAISRKNTAVAASSSIFTERECYQCLVEMEDILSTCVAVCRPPSTGRKARRKVQAPMKTSSALGPKSATEVLRIALDRGWVTLEGSCICSFEYFASPVLAFLQTYNGTQKQRADFAKNSSLSVYRRCILHKERVGPGHALFRWGWAARESSELIAFKNGADTQRVGFYLITKGKTTYVTFHSFDNVDIQTS
ncbi:Serine/threonine-protein kinase haspin [Grifola frondosa]|uniref:non-specific serine/threonine protein kinase n=1 Tax=Grifola frondosa TaxID=5627 RepID=A0A1C7MID3_GRIFR|nr:Serine/threonine-protein kinase haspin [Grifola frondosa]